MSPALGSGALATVAAALALVSCESGSPNAPWQGYAVAVIQTDGTLPDPDGYTIGLDASRQAAVTDDDSVIFALSAPGEHNLQISGLADNCASRARDGLIRVAPADHDTARAVFSVDCYDPTVHAVLNVRAVTEAPASHATFLVYVDGLRETPSPLRAPLSVLATVQGGWHKVELRPGNAFATGCTIEGGAQETVEVTTADTLHVWFTIDFCD